MSRPNFTAYRALFATLGREFLPAVTRRILDGEDTTTAALEEHYAWLLDQANGAA